MRSRPHGNPKPASPSNVAKNTGKTGASSRAASSENPPASTYRTSAAAPATDSDGSDSTGDWPP